VANSLTLVLLGWLFTKVPKEALRLFDIMPAWAKMPYSIITYLIQFFSVLVNITAIKTAFGMLGIARGWLPFSVALAAGVIAWGFGHVAKGNIVKYLVWMALLLFILFSGGHFTVTHSTGSDINWALYGALILFCAPILDQQMWQRRVAFGESGARPFLWATGMFAAYMVLVGLVAATGRGSAVVALIILLVAGSTLTSALSAVSCFHGSIGWARFYMCTVFIAAALCTGFGLSVLQIWVLYGSLRIPFAFGAIWRILSRRV
jgi:hypothetical protein